MTDRPRPSGPGRYMWVVGVAAFLLIVVVTINSINTDNPSPGGPEAGDRLVAFAVPLANGTLDGDANIAPKDDQGDLGKVAACKVRGPEILNICELAEKGPVVLAVFPTEANRCRAVMDQLSRIAPKLPSVQFAAVGSSGDRDDLRGRRPFPVGWDRDGAVVTVYRVVGCPQVTFANRGGKVVQTTRRELSDEAMIEIARRLR